MGTKTDAIEGKTDVKQTKPETSESQPDISASQTLSSATKNQTTTLTGRASRYQSEWELVGVSLKQGSDRIKLSSQSLKQEVDHTEFP